MPDYLPLLLLLAVAVGFLSLLFLTARFERRTTRPYVPVSETDQSVDRAYLTTMCAGLVANGFALVGLARQSAWLIKASCVVWISQDSRSLAVVGAATVAGTRQVQTTFYSQLADGRFLLTTDANDAGDLSGLFVVRRHVGGAMEKLWAKHQERLAERRDVVAWPEPSTVETVNDVLQKRAERLVARGRAYWLEPACSHWRHTTWGSLLTWGQFFKQLGGALLTPWRHMRGR